MASIEQIKGSDGSGNASVATVQNSRSPGASTIIVDTVAGMNAGGVMGSMGTPHTFTDPITSETITVISEATAVDFAGHIDSGNIEIDTIAPGYTDAGSEVGDIVIIRPTTQYADNTAEVLETAHKDDGNLQAIVNYDPSNPALETQKWTGVPLAVNEITVKNAVAGGHPEVQATGGDTNIDVSLVPKGTGNVKKGSNNIDWWEELARLTLTPAGDSMTTATFAAKKYLRIIVNAVPTGGTIRPNIRFNADSGNNYAVRKSENNGAETTNTSQSGVPTVTASAAQHNLVADVINILAQEKLITYLITSDGATATAAVAPNRADGSAKWSNTAAQITAVTIYNDGTGDFAIGSQVVVLGHD